MRFKLLFAVIIIVFKSLTGFAQDQLVVTGTIMDKEKGEPLPFASITLKNYQVGTTSNESGIFDFRIPASMRHDTLSVSYIGFNTYLVALNDIKGELTIALKPAENVLDEVILAEMGPLDYIKAAIKAMPENYPKEPFQSISYYREKFIENGRVINKNEAVFKTFYTASTDTAKNSHQLLLYHPTENPQKFMFMRDKYDKQVEKDRKKAKKKGEEFDEKAPEEYIIEGFGGPESILSLDINSRKEDMMNFLNPKHFKKYEYSFGPETVIGDEILITVNFKAKKTVEHVKDSGKILISKGSFAIALITVNGKLKIPAFVKPILFVIGLKVSNPVFSSTIQYQKFNDYWYPKLFRWDADIRLENRKMFSKNEVSRLQIGQLFSVNALSANPVPIPKEKQFDPEKPMEEQVYNDLNLDWSRINVIRD